MAGGDVLRTEFIRVPQQRAELQMFVAQDARVGCASGPIFGCKTADDFLLKCLRVVNQMERDAEVVAHGAHIGCRPVPAALELVLIG